MNPSPPVDRPTVAEADWLGRGRAAFNQGQFFEAHECWENAWRTLQGAERTFVQGLIQIAAGLHHLQQSRPAPGARLLAKGLEKLVQGAAARFPDLPVESLVHDVGHLLADLATANGGPLPHLSHDLIRLRIGPG